ncbi:hypothetical protein OEIGOIKO_05771 [Streptomyces chrestomyceticus JCM 4735]|uniref:Uncharacterized protein n=1 Tax=Streptomyces chrestomyceticus JCM 4735 TaxID=1306181 RepID=A0A7U9KYY6_9ACTN|nr:hypothetical protein [Streptomyces chrestomyceticus]GCD37961.1 hypothetical protein OEIGOIKO_05771 [Streptomyces chrestomyceticus JCM 4735]
MSAAQNAADAIQRLVEAANEYGLRSPEADSAARIVNVLLDAAHAAGATEDDIKNARG